MDESQTRPLRAAAVGAGKFGRYHAAKYRAMQGVELVGIVDSAPEALNSAAQHFGCQAFADVQGLRGKVDMVFIATPAMVHAGAAIQLLKDGVHLYIEKPLAAKLEDADRIIAAAKIKQCVLQVGHQERFLLDQMGLLAKKDTQVSSNVIEQLPGKAVLAPGQTDVIAARAKSRKGSFGDEVFAELQIGICVVKLFTSRIANKSDRQTRIEYDDGSIHIDFLARTIEDTRPITVKASFSDVDSGHPSFDPFGAAMADFVRCVRTGNSPLVTGGDGKRALHEALNILAVANSAATREGPRSIPSTEQISFFDLKSPAHRIRADVERRLSAVLDHMRYIDGHEVTALESALAAYTGARYALAVSSGTDALLVALMGEDLSKNDAVFLPAFTYNATCNAILTAGATPVFVDVDRKTCNIDPTSLEERIISTLHEGRLHPRIILTVDLYGLPAPSPQISHLAKSHNLLTLSDAAQSFGATQSGSRTGSLADMTATSFYPTKTLGAYGDASAFFTDDHARFQGWQSIRWHGTDSTRSESLRVGLNARLSSMRSAILLAKLNILPEELQARSALAARYRRRLEAAVPCQEVGTTADAHAYGLFTVMVEQRDHVQRMLKARGISTAVYYAKPLHRHQAFAKYAEELFLPNSEWLSKRVLSLPFHPYLSEGQVDRVCDALVEVLAGELRSRL